MSSNLDFQGHLQHSKRICYTMLTTKQYFNWEWTRSVVVWSCQHYAAFHGFESRHSPHCTDAADRKRTPCKVQVDVAQNRAPCVKLAIGWAYEEIK